VELLKALYGTLRAALLFWKLLSGKLVKWGFTINPYDWCVANKMIDGKQCTIIWHVNDLKISHMDPEVNTTVIGMIEAEFGKEAPLTITRGRIHEYLGMTLDYTKKGKVKIKMLDYVRKMLAELPEDWEGEALTPAANHLFTVDNNQQKVTEQQAHFSIPMSRRHCSYANAPGLTYRQPSHSYAPASSNVISMTIRNSNK
jgi:hypothetical protein